LEQQNVRKKTRVSLFDGRVHDPDFALDHGAFVQQFEIGVVIGLGISRHTLKRPRGSLSVCVHEKNVWQYV